MPELGRCSREALVEHGRDVADRQFVQARLADALIEIFVGFATASRLDAAVRQGGDRAADELTVGRKAIRNATVRARKALDGMESNDDALTTALSRVATAHATWPFSALP